MPCTFNLRAMSDGDLRAVYRHVRHLGPAGVPAPAYVPPGGAVATAVVRVSRAAARAVGSARSRQIWRSAGEWK